MSGRVFRRSSSPNPPVAVAAHGSTIVDADGREYLDAAGGAIVVDVGHGRREIADVLADQAARLSYAHGSAFTTEPLERYADEVGRHLPVVDPAIYPVSGGSEAMETALKLARAAQLARGEADRLIVFARWGSYHGNTLGALDLSGRKPLRRPYEGWLGRFRHLSAAYPYRASDPGSQALGDAGRAGRRAGPRDHHGRPGNCGRVRRRADRRRDAGGRRAAGRVLAGDRRGLPAPPRPAHRGRGHDGFRANRRMVRHGPLRRASGPAGGGQGCHVRLLAVRVRRGVGRDPRPRRGGRRVRARLHILAPAGWRGGCPGGAADSRDRGPGRGIRRQG